MVPGIPVQQQRFEKNLLEECRSLACVLAKKIEILNRECRSEHDKSLHIRTMGFTLANLTARVNSPDHDTRTLQSSEILEDVRGFTYQSVRSCDLERIREK